MGLTCQVPGCDNPHWWVPDVVYLALSDNALDNIYAHYPGLLVLCDEHAEGRLS